MNKLLMSATLALATAFSTTALAADTDKPFDGFYLGVEAGLYRASVNNLSSGANMAASSIYLGGALGWRNQWDSGFVLGIEYDRAHVDAKDTDRFTDEEGHLIAFQSFSVTRQSVLNLSLGHVLGANKRLLGFVTSGISVVPHDGHDNAMWNLGGGIEYALNEHVSIRARAEYGFKIRLSDFGDFKDSSLVGGLLWRF